MAHRKDLWETELKNTNDALAARKKLLESRKVDAKAQEKDTIFRQLKARAKMFKNRVAAITAQLELNAATEARKAERLATPKAPKEKKKKEVAPAKAKGGGKPAKEKKPAT